MHMRKLTEHIYCMDANAETDQPFVFYIHGENRSLLVDAGNSPENYWKLLGELQECGLPEPDLIALTHWHWDHTFGVCAAECPVIASEATDRILKNVSAWKWDDDSMRQRLATGEDILFTYDCMKKQYPDTRAIVVKRPDITFSERMMIDLGGVVCYLEHRDSPHTRDAVMIYIPADEVLIGGDAHYEDYYDNDSKHDRKRLRSFMDYLNAIPFVHYLKGHDEPEISKTAMLELLESASEDPERTVG